MRPDAPNAPRETQTHMPPAHSALHVAQPPLGPSSRSAASWLSAPRLLSKSLREYQTGSPCLSTQSLGTSSPDRRLALPGTALCHPRQTVTCCVHDGVLLQVPPRTRYRCPLVQSRHTPRASYQGGHPLWCPLSTAHSLTSSQRHPPHQPRVTHSSSDRCLFWPSTTCC